MAFEFVKAMRSDGLDWCEGYRQLGRDALAEIIEERMGEAVDRWLEGLGRDDAPDRRNGFYHRHLLTELGDIEIAVPRTRRFSPCEVLRAYARRAPEVDRVILAGFVLGLSTRKVGEALLAILGQKVSATTVSRVAKTLDAAVLAFHRRPLQDRYTALMLDGVVLARKTGAGAIRRPVLVALGLRPDGKKEVIDFHLAASESAAEWRRFLESLYRRGLEGRGLDMICVDGGPGLAAALPQVYHAIPVQRCWAHKIRNILDKIKAADREPAKQALRQIVNAPGIVKARAAARSFAGSFQEAYPRAVACLRDDLDELLTCFRYTSPEKRKQVRTTNAIERRFREVRRRTRPMGTFQDITSMDRILFAVFANENKSQGVSTLFLLTQIN
ncbi:MAG: IS256 family transposase [Rhizobiales bacterium]|nr:IS256 family transposase [Hyphomicrobiales bacterium]